MLIRFVRTLRRTNEISNQKPNGSYTANDEANEAEFALFGRLVFFVKFNFGNDIRWGVLLGAWFLLHIRVKFGLLLLKQRIVVACLKKGNVFITSFITSQMKNLHGYLIYSSAHFNNFSLMLLSFFTLKFTLSKEFCVRQKWKTTLNWFLMRVWGSVVSKT